MPLARAGLSGSLLLSSSLLAACAEPPPPAALTAPIFVTAAGDTVPLVQRRRFGALEGPVHEAFGSVVWIQPLRHGEVAIGDLGERSRGIVIYHYDSAGAYLGRIAEPGDGPDAYGTAPAPTRLTGGDLLLWEQSPPRIHRVQHGGDVVEHFTPGRGSLLAVTPAVDGGWFTTFGPNVHRGSGAGPVWFLRFDAQGRRVDSLGAPSGYVEGGVGALEGETMFAAILPDGRGVLARTDSFMVRVVGPDSTSTFVHHDVPPAYDVRERKAALGVMRHLIRRAGGDARTAEVPRTKPAFHELRVTDDGVIATVLSTKAVAWRDSASLRPNQTPWREPLALDLYDPDRGRLGRVVAPVEVHPRRFTVTADGIWLVHEGPEGEHYVTFWAAPGGRWGGAPTSR